MDISFEALKNKFENQDIATEVILPNVKLLDQYSKQSPAFNDPKYIPFYYRLGYEISPIIVTQIGSNLGLIASSFLKSCKTVIEWTFIDQNKKINNIIKSNVYLSHNCKLSFIYLENRDIDDKKINQNYNNMVLITEDFLDTDFQKYLEYSWKILNNDGFLVVDYLCVKQKKEKFLEFCSIKNREPTLFNTRYKVGIVIK